MDPFVGEIRVVGFNFAPKGWATCDGQLLPLSQNTALFSLLGTFYGGDGKSNFALPDFQGNSAMAQGQGPGLSDRFLGEVVGAQTVTLIQSEMTVHNHTLMGRNDPAELQAPAPDRAFARTTSGFLYTTNAPNVNMAFQTLGIAGSSFPHNNMQPGLTLNFIIALQGVFPPRG